MSQEAILFENGQEIDWIDPVISIEENEHEWIVDNGYFKYHLTKGKYKELVIRNRSEHS